MYLGGGVCIGGGSASGEGVCVWGRDLHLGKGSASGGGVCIWGLAVEQTPYGGWADPPVDRQTPVKTLPCPKLRLPAEVIIKINCFN